MAQYNGPKTQSVNMSGHTITSLGAAGSAANASTLASTHTHTVNAGHVGSPANNVVIAGGSITAHTTATYGSKGTIKFGDDGNIYAHDGNDWIPIAGLDHTTKIDEIKKELCANFPEAAFDLMMKGLI